MDWIFENLQILFVIAAAVAYWLNSLRQAKEEGEQDHGRDDRPVEVEDIFGPDFDFNSPPSQQRGDSPPQGEVFLPPRVATSQSVGSVPPPLPGQQELRREMREARNFPSASPMPQRPQGPVSPHQTTAAPASHAEELERQRKLDERLRSLRHNREKRSTGAAATQRSVVAKRAARKGVVEEVADPTSIGGIRSRLRSTREARRAIVMREILGTPVGMR